MDLPPLPIASFQDFIPYFNRQGAPSSEILRPFLLYENELRKVYAQQPDHSAVIGGRECNLVTIYDGTGSQLRIRARDIEAETVEDKSRYLMQLGPTNRKSTGDQAVVASFEDFQKNFNIFSESSLADLDWNNVVACGSSVTTSLVPVPDRWAKSKRSLRQYYHEEFAPASDVDLFLYGLTEAQAVDKIKQIERAVKDSLLAETTTIRTKNAITIASQYPTRHIQIVLRLYDSISQIITGFDVDCACVAYNGKQVYASPRALVAFATQCNTVDLTRRSPSYENRLSKYSHRGFEIYWPLLDRSRVDPTIFERSFQRTQGLARLLVLEKFPREKHRDQYLDKRRERRGRPRANRQSRYQRRIWGNIKDDEEDEVPDWQIDEHDVSNYHTMIIPYGKKFSAAKIARILYAKDLLLNAEWNKPKDRTVKLHRHPCFFGDAVDALEDCCGFCPVPETEEEIEVALEEDKIFVKGRVEFLKDDPGRQEIGSFNPIDQEGWTEMAYVGNTQMLNQAIVDCDLDCVESWCLQEGNDINTRDYTGRTPLHLAIMCSSLQAVQLLINHGARLTARVIDGRNCLHLAAQQGKNDVLKALLLKSSQNETLNEERQALKRQKEPAISSAKSATKPSDFDGGSSDGESLSSGSDDDDDDDDESEGRTTQGSFVVVGGGSVKMHDALEDDENEPDILEVDAVAWDTGAAALHFAICGGFLNTVRLLIDEYGADLKFPIKVVLHEIYGQPKQAILSLVLAAIALPADTAQAVVRLLLELGATTSQADLKGRTVLQYFTRSPPELIDLLFEIDGPSARAALQHVSFDQSWSRTPVNPLILAIKSRDIEMVRKLLSHGASPTVAFDDWLSTLFSVDQYAKNRTTEENRINFELNCVQPIITAANIEEPEMIRCLVQAGADVNAIDRAGNSILRSSMAMYSHQKGRTAMDYVQERIQKLKNHVEVKHRPQKPEHLESDDHYLGAFTPGTYRHFAAFSSLQQKKQQSARAEIQYRKDLADLDNRGEHEKELAVQSLIREYEAVEAALLTAGAKTFKELHPNVNEREPPYVHGVSDQQIVKPFKPTSTFNIPNLNATTIAGYRKLFEAVWDNDIETVKSMTLKPWKVADADAEQAPLEIATMERTVEGTSPLNFSPFSLAVMRNHLELATVIVDICQAQYQPETEQKAKKTWRIIASDDDSDSEQSSDSKDDGPQIAGESVNDEFTIENVLTARGHVKSNVKPLAMIKWSCKSGWFKKSPSDAGFSDNTALLKHALHADDLHLMKFVLRIGAKATTLAATTDDDPKFYRVDQSILAEALKLGKTSMLAMLIKATGVGIPFETMVEKSGVIIKEAPKYYQGLTIAGKKRADWALAGRPSEWEPSFGNSMTPPLLLAAMHRNLASIEWLLSDSPARLYQEFKEVNADDQRIKTLEQSKSGFDGLIDDWLHTRNFLALHGAVAKHRRSDGEDVKVIKYLIEVMPEALNHKSKNGYTPLSIAVLAYQDPPLAKLLIEAGADERARDTHGRNMLHYLLVPVTVYPGKAGLIPTSNPEAFRAMLEPFDKHELAAMLLERCHVPGKISAPPLAYWLYHTCGDIHDIEILGTLRSFADDSVLEMIDEAGNLPLHIAVKQGFPPIVGQLISMKPALLHRENAVGITPLELARDLWIQEVVAEPPNLEMPDASLIRDEHGYLSVLDRPAKEFVPDKDTEAESEPKPNRRRTYEVCFESAAQYPHKRRLVSLFEANELAKSLVTKNEEESSCQPERDEVDDWLPSGAGRYGLEH